MAMVKQLAGKPPLLFAGGLLIGVVIAVVLATQVLAPKAPAEPAKTDVAAKAGTAKEGVKESKEADKEAQGPAPTYEVSGRIVNLADPGGRRYLRTSMVIEFAAHDPSLASKKDKELEKALKEVNSHFANLYGARIQDTITTVLSSKTFNDIATPEGKESLKIEIKERLEQLLKGEKITAVYLTEFVVQ